MFTNSHYFPLSKIKTKTASCKINIVRQVVSSNITQIVKLCNILIATEVNSLQS